MIEDNYHFAQAEIKYLQGARLTVEELNYMETVLESSEGREISIACGAILRVVNSQPYQRCKARAALKRLCEHLAAGRHGIEINLPDENTKTELSITLMLIPSSEIQHEFIKPFIYAIAKSERYTLRANAVLLLGRLAAGGDPQALQLLHLAAKDTQPEVRNNAEIELRKLARF
jgi:hypothetical protein